MTKEEILKDIRAIDDKDNPLLRCDNDGKAMLYIVEKTAERTKREMVEKASKFIHDTIFSWANDYDLDAGLTWNELRAKYIERFKQAMENETAND